MFAWFAYLLTFFFLAGLNARKMFSTTRKLKGEPPLLLLSSSPSKMIKIKKKGKHKAFYSISYTRDRRREQVQGNLEKRESKSWHKVLLQQTRVKYCYKETTMNKWRKVRQLKEWSTSLINVTIKIIHVCSAYGWKNGTRGRRDMCHQHHNHSPKWYYVINHKPIKPRHLKWLLGTWK